MATGVALTRPGGYDRALMPGFTVFLRRATHRVTGLPVACVVFVLVVFALVAPFPCETRAQIAGTIIPGVDEDLVKASLLSDARAIAPGQPFRIAVSLTPKPGWHLNWINPGDAGLAPSVAWHLPPGFKAGPACWPLPSRITTGPLVIFGYEEELLLVVDVRTPANATPGTTIEFKAGVSWLACNEACIPGSAELALQLPVASKAAVDAGNAQRFDLSMAECPRALLDWGVEARVNSQGFIVLQISTAGAASAPTAVLFFPYETGIIENAAPQLSSVLNGPGGRATYQLKVEISRMATKLPSRLSGILVAQSGWSRSGETRAIEFDVPLDRR